MVKAYFNWSTGKDSSMALHKLQQENKLTIDRLLTTINGHHDRVSMHGLRRTLLLQQAESIGLPLTIVELPEEPTMEDYNSIMGDTVNQLKLDGYLNCGFGDIFLEDLRQYRESRLEGITCHFPLWKEDTSTLIQYFIKQGFKAIVLCVNSEFLDESFVGRELDESFVNDLPAHVDPCGENGEFHTFCYDGPIFSKPIQFVKGEKVLKQYTKPKQNDNQKEEFGGHWFIDLLPVEESY